MSKRKDHSASQSDDQAAPKGCRENHVSLQFTGITRCKGCGKALNAHRSEIPRCPHGCYKGESDSLLAAACSICQSLQVA